MWAMFLSTHSECIYDKTVNVTTCISLPGCLWGVSVQAGCGGWLTREVASTWVVSSCLCGLSVSPGTGCQSQPALGLHLYCRFVFVLGSVVQVRAVTGCHKQRTGGVRGGGLWHRAIVLKFSAKSVWCNIQIERDCCSGLNPSVKDKEVW